MATIIDALNTYFLAYSSLKTGAPLWVDFLGQVPTEYSISPLPGNRVLEAYISGGSKRQFPFAFSSMESTADNLERLANIGFYEAFADWLESQTLANVLPALAAGKTPTELEALDSGYLFEQGESGTGIYQIQCRLIYEQAKP